MVPRESGRGASFKGAGLYYLHDKNALTSERVQFVHCENLPTQDPQKALGWMAWTCKIAPELKVAAGVPPTGRKSTGRPVYTVALSWHPEQKPTKKEMIAQGRAWLDKQGLKDHQAVMVSHSDRDHPHLHLVVNLAHPKTGVVANLSFSKLKSSRWAQAFEEASGKVYCKERVENNRQRDKGEKNDTAKALKEKTTRLYAAADGGKSFVGAMRDEGLVIAKGKRIVVLTQDGEIHNLARLIEGAKEKDIRQRLLTVSLPTIEAAKAAQQVFKSKRKPSEQSASQELQYDRDAQDSEWQESIIDAGLRHNDSPRIKALASPPLTELKNAMQSRHHEEKAALQARFHEARLRQADELKQIYGSQESELRDELASLEQKQEKPGAIRHWVRAITGQVKREEDSIKRLRAGVANIEWRKAECRTTLSARALREETALSRKHEIEWKSLFPDPSPSLPQPPRDLNDHRLRESHREASEITRQASDRRAQPSLSLSADR